MKKEVHTFSQSTKFCVMAPTPAKNKLQSDSLIDSSPQTDRGGREKSKLEPHHLKQREVSGSHVVEVDFNFAPVVLRAVQGQTLGLVVDVGGVVDEARSVDAAAELPGEQVDAHDAEDEPEDQTHQQHVHDGRDGADQSVNHHLVTEETNHLSVCCHVHSNAIRPCFISDFRSDTEGHKQTLGCCQWLVDNDL